MSKYLKIAVALAALALLVAALDWREALGRLGQADPVWILAAVAINVGGILLSALRWHALVPPAALALSRLQAIRLYWIGSLASKFLPSSVGGDVVRGAMAARLGSASAAVSSILVERLTGFWCLSLLAVLALALLPVGDAPLPAQAVLVAMLAVGLVAGPSLVLSRPARRYLEPRLDAAGWPARLRRSLARVAHSIDEYRGKPATLAATIALSLVYYAMLLAMQAAVLAAVGAPPEPLAVLVAAPLVLLAGNLPIAIHGIGVSEAAFVFFYARMGIDPEIALAAALLRRLIVTVTALAALPFWFADRGLGRQPVS